MAQSRVPLLGPSGVVESIEFDECGLGQFGDVFVWAGDLFGYSLGDGPALEGWAGFDGDFFIGGAVVGFNLRPQSQQNL